MRPTLQNFGKSLLKGLLEPTFLLFLMLFFLSKGTAADPTGGQELYVATYDPSASPAFVSIDDSIYAREFWRVTTFTKISPMDPSKIKSRRRQ